MGPNEDDDDADLDELGHEEAFRPLDFDDESSLDNELDPSLEDYLNAHLDKIEEKDSIIDERDDREALEV